MARPPEPGVVGWAADPMGKSHSNTTGFSEQEPGHANIHDKDLHVITSCIADAVRSTFRDKAHRFGAQLSIYILWSI